jgi:hypothetical protein
MHPFIGVTLDQRAGVRVGQFVKVGNKLRPDVIGGGEFLRQALESFLHKAMGQVRVKFLYERINSSRSAGSKGRCMYFLSISKRIPMA